MPSWKLSWERHPFSLVLSNAFKTRKSISMVFCINEKKKKTASLVFLIVINKTFLNLLQILALYLKGPSISTMKLSVFLNVFLTSTHIFAPPMVLSTVLFSLYALRSHPQPQLSLPNILLQP